MTGAVVPVVNITIKYIELYDGKEVVSVKYKLIKLLYRYVIPLNFYNHFLTRGFIYLQFT